MPRIDKHAPGSFCWIELATTDQAAAKSFYSSLFGWKANDFPMGPDGSYTIFQTDGRDAGAAFGMNADMRSQGVPPHWGIYVAVVNADDATARAVTAGATVCVRPFDVADLGRMAVLQDSTGAHFNIWQAKNHPGTTISGVPGTLCWADLSTPDAAGASQFYKTLFGWEIMAGQDDSGYLHIKNGEQFIGGIPPAAHRNPNTPPHWLSYFQVADCDASTAKAKELGATVYMGPMTMEGVGRWSVVADPQGAVLALFQPLPHQ
jgi:predicted enzyme related to lactoylglutathione lyase